MTPTRTALRVLPAALVAAALVAAPAASARHMVDPPTPVTPSVPSTWGTKRGNTHIYRITARQFTQKIANFPIRTATVWGYKAAGTRLSTPGPTLLAHQGERVRLIITNELPEGTTVHLHGMHEPNGPNDGVAGISENPIMPGQTRVYPAFKPGHAGTFAYHTHANTATQEPRGLAGAFIVMPRRVRRSQRPDRDFMMTLQQFDPPSEGALVNPMPESGEFPFSTINGKTGDASGRPLTIRKGDLVQIRLYNASPKTHSMHLHGHDERLVAINGHPVRPRRITTKSIAPGEFFTIQFRANNPGNWIFHCSFSQHQANKGKSGFEGAPVGMTRVFHYAGYRRVPPQYFSFSG